MDSEILYLLANMFPGGAPISYSASSSSPSGPIQGQIWYQTDTSAILVYSGSTWINTYPSGVPSGRMTAFAQTIVAPSANVQVTSMITNYAKGNIDVCNNTGSGTANAITVKQTGIYLVTASAGFQISSGAPNAGVYYMVINVNGSSLREIISYLPAATNASFALTDTISLTAGQVLTYNVVNGTGSNVATTPSGLQTFMSATLISQ